MQRSIQRDIGIGIAASLISTAAIGGGTYMTGVLRTTVENAVGR